MQLYHYRSIKSALLEIGDGTFHFASREELNDPIEGFVGVYWQGDKAAWEGLFRNYDCSLYHGIGLYQLQGDEAQLHHMSLVVDIHAFDNVPLGAIWKSIGDQFLANATIQKLVDFYGSNQLKVAEEELRLILHFIHKIAITICIQSSVEHKMTPEEEGSRLLEIFRSEDPPFPFEIMEAELSDEEHRATITKAAEDIIEDMRELQYVRFGFDDETFLYGKRSPEELVDSKRERTEARQRRDWMTISVDFPKVYVNQLKDMVYPESFTVCFSTKNNDSAMWGNYAEYHKGVCLVYDFDDTIAVKGKEHTYQVKPRPVCYEGERIERNFFESFGRLTFSQIKGWITGTDGVSACYNVFSDEQAWRDSYWAAYEAKTYRKLKAWEYEQEYRVTLANTFYSFNTPESRNLKYDPKVLKGIIFGINTSEYDKKRIMEKLLERGDELSDFVFYQAEYDDVKQEIAIREKKLWKV